MDEKGIRTQRKRFIIKHRQREMGDVRNKKKQKQRVTEGLGYTRV